MFCNYYNYIKSESKYKPIPVSSPMDAVTISNQIKRISEAQTPYLNGKILSLSVILAYRLGLKRQEIIDLSIGEVTQGRGKISQTISINNEEVRLPTDLQEVICSHIKYLRERGYNHKKDAPLIPMKNKIRYYSKKLDVDFKKIVIQCGFKPHLEEFRKSGICHYYEKLMVAGCEPLKALEMTSLFARCTQRQTFGILTDSIENKLRRPRKVLYAARFPSDSY